LPQRDFPSLVTQTAVPPSQPHSERATREEKTIAWLILLLKESRGVR
jgi:hypothetical protein